MDQTSKENAFDFDTDFRALMGFAPMHWQARLYSQHFSKGTIPGAIDIPTGLGKTAVMPLWLIARARGAALPRRLVYVVDRRAVVDQATAEAERLRGALQTDRAAQLKKQLRLTGPLPISTLRGQFIDNREWLENPAAPAIIVGTVDMIGSRLLFEGYGVSRKMRPYHAGLLGADALVVLDEAHLVPPFQHLLRKVERQAPEWASAETKELVPPFRFLPLSATQREDAGDTEDEVRPTFRLEPRDWEHDETASQRLGARKVLRLIPCDSKDQDQQLANEAWRLASECGPRRVIVFCSRRDKKPTGDNAGPSAQGVFDAIKKLAQGDKKSEREATEIDIELLVGGRRQKEREKVAERLTEMGFVASEDRAALQKPTFLIATSAGEVGVDIDADHMVSDLAPWERMVQRLGRVNRRGAGDAQIAVFWAEPNVEKAWKPTDAEQRALIAFNAKAALERLPESEGGEGCRDTSPGALRALAGDANAKEAIAAATTPEPLRPALSLPLVEAWSMTSLEEHTGRPEIAPWLRGWVDELPQTTLVWRTHLPVRVGADKGSQTKADENEVVAFFEAAPPHESEKLETETYRVVEWLQKRAEAISKPSGSSKAESKGTDADEPHGLSADDLTAIALSPAGEFVQACALKALTGDKKVKDRLQADLAGKTLILDARFAGLKSGLLDADATDIPETLDADTLWSERAKMRVLRLSEPRRHERDWREAFAFPTQLDLEGAPTEWLFVDQMREAPRTEEARALSGRAQTLEEHQSWTEERARAIAEALELSDDAREALAVAAYLHDEGKRAERWQKAFKAQRDAHANGLTGPLAKTRGPIDQAMLDGYRHEFGSLRYVEVHERFKALADDGWRDLVLHLVAAHHGQARPVIGTTGCEDAPPSALEDRARDVALRFAGLQKRWGPWGLAWWETLLRAADQQASRALEDKAPDEAQEAL